MGCMESILDDRGTWFTASVLLVLAGALVIVLGIGVSGPAGVVAVVAGAACITAAFPVFSGRMGVSAAVLAAGVVLAAALAVVLADGAALADIAGASGAPAEMRGMECTAVGSGSTWTLICRP